MRHVIILGAGISGLTTAWLIKTRLKNTHVTLLERSARVGGWIQTTYHQGFFFENGPRGFRPKGKGGLTLSLVKELGLEKELIFSNPDAKKRYLYLNEKLRLFSPLLLIQHGLLSAAWKEWRTPPSTKQDESIRDFFCRRLNHPLAENIARPAVQGIFGGDIGSLSLRCCFPLLHAWEQNKGSILKGYFEARKKKEKSPLPPLCSFKKGMETLPLALVEQCGAAVHLSTEIQKIEGNTITTSHGTLTGDHIVVALPAYALKDLFPPAAALLNPLPFLSLTLVQLGYSAHLLKQKGFGYLIPLNEEEGVLGMTWDSSIFPEHNQGHETRLCVMIRGEMPQNKSFHLALKAAKAHLGIHDTPMVISSFTAKHAIPQYPVGFHQRLAQLHFPNLSFIGSSFGAIGINDCIAQAHAISSQI